MKSHARYAINVVENAGNEILLLKRQPEAALGAGLWGFPAGHIENGETPEACALRELAEELGPEFSIQTLNKLSPLRNSLHGGNDEIHLFHQRWLEGKVVLNREHTAYAWVGKEEFRNYDVLDGVDEDLLYLGIWPRQYLNPKKIPSRRR